MSTRGSHSAIRVQSPWAEGMGTPPGPALPGTAAPGGVTLLPAAELAASAWTHLAQQLPFHREERGR